MVSSRKSAIHFEMLNVAPSADETPPGAEAKISKPAPEYLAANMCKLTRAARGRIGQKGDRVTGRAFQITAGCGKFSSDGFQTTVRRIYSGRVVEMRARAWDECEPPSSGPEICYF
jgi:hypothetical protein